MTLFTYFVTKFTIKRMLCHGEINKLIALYVSIYVVENLVYCVSWWHPSLSGCWSYFWSCNLMTLLCSLVTILWMESHLYRARFIISNIVWTTFRHNDTQLRSKTTKALRFACLSKPSTTLIELWRWCCFYTKEAWENRKACSPVSINWFLNDSLTKLWSGPIIQTSHCCH